LVEFSKEIKTTIRLVHLYSREMSIYGDVSNLLVITFIFKELGLEYEIFNYQNISESLDFLNSVDFFFLGGGQDQDQENILKDLFKIKETIKKKIYQEGAIFLGICGGYQLLGEYYELAKKRLEGLSLLDLYTRKPTNETKNKRLIGNTKAISQNKLIGEIFGFENHAGRTFLNKKTSPLAKIKQGSGNNSLDKTEGAFVQFGKGLILGSYFHSFLPKNFQVALFIVRSILKNKRVEVSEEKFWKLNQTLENFNRIQLKKLKY